jgi:hypothetical protein
MTPIDEARASLRSRQRGQPQKEPWRQPTMRDFHWFDRVLAFDATLTNCGWVKFVVLPDKVDVIAKGTLRPKTAEVGYLGTWDKADRLRQEIDLVIGSHGRATGGTTLVVEAPSVGGGSRTESSLIAGMMVWSARPGWCRVVSATHVSAVLLGDAKVRSAERKKLIREAVIALCPEAAGRGWNEHERDGLATGLTHLHDVKSVLREQEERSPE